MNFDAQVAEAIHTITSLWTTDLVQEVANDGIIVTIDDAQDGAIVSCHSGTILWRGLTTPWAFAFLTAAKMVVKSLSRDMD
jgi:ribosomal protein S11